MSRVRYLENRFQRFRTLSERNCFVLFLSDEAWYRHGRLRRVTQRWVGEIARDVNIARDLYDSTVSLLLRFRFASRMGTWSFMLKEFWTHAIRFFASSSLLFLLTFCRLIVLNKWKDVPPPLIGCTSSHGWSPIKHNHPQYGLQLVHKQRHVMSAFIEHQMPHRHTHPMNSEQVKTSLSRWLSASELSGDENVWSCESTTERRVEHGSTVGEGRAIENEQLHAICNYGIVTREIFNA